ncbi:hypothetical protein H5410_022980 [Solanum commersonii]|uniref:Uncharacterized protein n=1 Tax=Solanum commersonii TaxID=4109 RepID=A0A9J5ZFK5_SOLCO|nr:hypothetical protein H5410_022980 [Solanum commersonii]
MVTANCIPGQLLLPEPNGRSWKSRPRKSTLLPTNLSGRILPPFYRGLPLVATPFGVSSSLGGA